MKARHTANKAHLTERQKAWARLALLTVVGLVCPPLAAAKSVAVWVMYLVLGILYSLWTIRATRAVKLDGRLGYLLCLTDGIVLVPILVWSQGVSMRVVLVFLWVVGAAATWRAYRARQQLSRPRTAAGRAAGTSQAPPKEDHTLTCETEAPLERALRVRLRALQADHARFALVLLRARGQEGFVTQRGEDVAKELLRDMGRRGLRLLGPDAQLFLLPGGRMAYVFATDPAREYGRSRNCRTPDYIDPYDVESLAMALAGRACEQAAGGRQLECVVGWASAPADGTSADDLIYAAESGALSSAAFRRVGGSRIPVPELEKKRAVAG